MWIESLTLVFLLFTFLFIGVPVAISLGLSTVVTMFIFTSTNPIVVTEWMAVGMSHDTLMAIPMFMLAGSLMTKGSSSARIIEFAKSLVGHLPGGLPMSGILACIIFAAISGSSPATVAAIGSVMFLAIKKEGYSQAYAVGSITSAGSLGILIPPSIGMIVYAVVTNTSVERLFMAGIIPGIMLGLMMMIFAYLGAVRLGIKRKKMANIKFIFSTFIKAFWALMIIPIIVGGIYGGFFTPTEAAGVSCVYAFIVGYFVYRDVKFKDLYSIGLDAIITSAMIFFVIGSATVFSKFLTLEQIPNQIAMFLQDSNINWVVFLILVNIALFIMGQFMEAVSILTIMAPLLFPVALSFGIDPIHFGIIMIVNLEIGMITPPVGLNLFVASGMTKLGLKEVSLAVLPWTILMIIGLILITYIPQISLYLPNLYTSMRY